MTKTAKSGKVASRKIPEAKTMSSIHYVDNSFVTGKAKSSYTFSKVGGTYFPWRVFLLPAVLSVGGFLLLYFSFFPNPGFFDTRAVASSSYPPKLAEVSPSPKLQTGSLAIDQITSAKGDQNTSTANFVGANVNVSGLNLSSKVQWPMRGPITTYYSYYHPGIDIAAPYGTPVYPFMEGVVVEIKRESWGFGNSVRLRHDGGYESIYAHLSTIHVNIGDRVGLNTMIAREGSSGYSTGPHLMLEIFHNGTLVNPLAILP